MDLAAANGQDDIINVEICAGAGCATVGQFSVYDIVTPLTFTSSEGRSLTIDGTNSNNRILRGGSNNNNGILFIDTTGATDDFNAAIVVRGLTIVEGNNTGTPNDGGGLYIHVNRPRVEVSGSVFGGNAADGDGGALFIRAEQSGEFPIQIYDVTFDTNSAGGGGGGAHVSASNTHFVEIWDVFFWDNDAANGGGLEVEGLNPADPVFERVATVSLFDIDFDDNFARTSNGGGADIGTVVFDMSVTGFVRNQALNGNGAGLYLRRNFSIVDIVNSGFAYNITLGDGGGFAFEQNDGPLITITNNTIYGNEANGRGAGGLLTVGGSTGWARVYNNIIYTNTGANAGNDIYIDNDPFNDIPAMVDFFNNNITDIGNFPANASFEIVSAADLNFDFNLGGDPMLVNMSVDDPDPHQSQNSQTINAGDNAAPGVPSQDYEGDPRPTDNIVDIGMDEYVAGALPSVDLSVTKTDSPDPVIGGQNVTYTITVTNNSQIDATGVTVVDTLDVNSTLVSATFDQVTCTSAGTPPQQPTVVTCVLGDLAQGTSAPGTIVVTSSDDPQVTGIANSVTVSGNEDDPNSANNTAQQGTTVVEDTGPPQADLAVTKTDTPDPVFSGGPLLTYTITVSNNGPDDAAGVSVVDFLPDGVAFVSASTTVGQCDAQPDGTGQFACGLGTLASGSNATVTIVVDPDDVTDTATIINTATVSATTEDPNLTNNSVDETTTVEPPAADMMVDTTSSPASPMINEQVTYSVTVTNDGPSDDTGVVLTVTLPASATFESVSIEQGTCDVDNGTVTCTIGDLASGISVVATIVVTAPGEATTLTLSATLVADVADPTPGNNVDSYAVTVIDVIDLIIEGESEGAGSVTLLELLFAAVIGVVFYLRRRGLASGRFLSAVGVVALGSMLLILPDHQANAEGNWYVGAGIGGSDADYSAGNLQSDLASLGWSINNVSVDDTDTAWKAYVGFAFNEYIALEGGYADLGEAETRFGATVAPTQIDAILADTFRVHPVLGDGFFGSVVMSWPVSPDQFSLTGRVGMFMWEADIEVQVVSGGTGRVSGDDDGTDMLYGVGFEWHLNQQWSLTGDWERYKLDDWVDVPSVGLKYSF